MNEQVKLAMTIATKAHDGQFRWDNETPYISHPAAIAKELERQEFADAVIATAWLHDVVEDTDITFHNLDEAGVHPEIIAAVDAITKRDGEDYLMYLLRCRKNAVARIVKIEDIKNNMSDLDRKKKKSMYEKYSLALYILNEQHDGKGS